MSFFPACRRTEALDEVVHGPDGLVQLGAAWSGRGRARLLSGSGQAAAHCAARGEGRVLHRRRSRPARPAWCRRARAWSFSPATQQACKTIEPVVAGFADSCIYFGGVRRGEPGQAHQQSSGRDQYRRHRRSDGARAQSRRRCRSDDQGHRRWQRRLDAVRHPGAVDGGAALQAAARPDPRLAALFRDDRRIRRRCRRGDAAARSHRRTVRSVCGDGISRMRWRRHDRRHRLAAARNPKVRSPKEPTANDKGESA